MHIMIPRGTQLPYSTSGIFSTKTLEQEQAGIEMYEGNSGDTTQNELIGSVILSHESKEDTIDLINKSVQKGQNDKKEQDDKSNNNKANNERQSNKTNKTKYKNDKKSNNYNKSNNNNENKQNNDNTSDNDNKVSGWDLKIKVEQNSDGILYVTAKQTDNKWNTCSMTCLTSLTMIEHDKLLLINKDRKLINQIKNQLYDLETICLSKVNRKVVLTVMKYIKIHGNTDSSTSKIVILEKYNNVLKEIYEEDKDLEKEICTWGKSKIEQLHEIDYNLYLNNKNKHEDNPENDNESENSLNESDNDSDNTYDENYNTDKDESDNENNDNVTHNVKLNVSTKKTKITSKYKSTKKSKKQSNKRSKQNSKSKSKKRKNRDKDFADILHPSKRQKLDKQ